MAIAAVIDPNAAKATAKGVDDKLIRLIRTGLVANIFLLIAGSMDVGFYVRELFVKWWTRDVVGDALYLTGFSAFFLSGFLELWIDVGWVRSFSHGRYTTKKGVNIMITILFLLGNIGNLIAFIFWRRGKEGIQAEHITQWVASNIFLLTALIVLIANRPKYVPFQNRMDSVANVFFFVESLMACCARYVSTVGQTTMNPTEMHFEIAAASFAIASALCYVVADLIRIRDPDSIVFS